MTPAQALEKADELLRHSRVSRRRRLTTKNFLEYADLVNQVVLSFGAKKREQFPWLRDWAETWRMMCDEFEGLVQHDPMLIYAPAHKVSYDFHTSKAFIRYFRAGNRTSKTQSGYAEHYFVATRQHRFRSYSSGPQSTFIVSGLPFTVYAETVFERKFLSGEPGNPLSPMFPEGGKWFNRYDSRLRTIYIACPDCAEKGKAGSCQHQKSTITLYSGESGPGVIEAFSGILAHGDEHLEEPFFGAMQQRIADTPGSCMLFTGTPLHGTEAWERRKLADKANGNPEDNRVRPDDPKSPKYVEMFEIDQFTAGIVSRETIEKNMQGMDEFEIECRVYGKPAPLAQTPVFDRKLLQEMRTRATEPVFRGTLEPDLEQWHKFPDLRRLRHDNCKMNLIEDENAALRIWEHPQPRVGYVIGVDTAKGISSGTKDKKGDPSCATVLRTEFDGLSVKLKQVAQWHSWANMFDYAAEVMMLACYYNSSLVGIETTGGYGEAVVLKMREWGYWNLYVPPSDQKLIEQRPDAKIGVDTNIASKPFMIACVQKMLRGQALDIPCEDTISELVAYEQEIPKSGHIVRYQGATGSYDDRVMSLCIACSIALTYPEFQFVTESFSGYNQDRPKHDKEWKGIFDDLHEQQRIQEDEERAYLEDVIYE